MGLYGAMTTAVAGLQAQSYSLENISGNIANSQTTGFKRVDTSFSDIVMSFGTTAARQNSGSVFAQSRATNMIQGAVNSASVDTYMAISGDGYFQVQTKTGESDNQAVFSGANVYTRRGDFSVDKQGYLVNGAGYYLMAIPIDTTTGNAAGNVPEVVKLSSGYLAANASSKINYNANLPSDPRVGLLDQSDFVTNPARSTVSATPATVASTTAPTAYADIDVSGTNALSAVINGVSVVLDASADADSSGTLDINEAMSAIQNQLTAASADVAVSNDGTYLTFSTVTGTGTTAYISIADATASNLGWGTSSTTVTGTNAIAAGSGIVTADDYDTFQTQSLDGGSVTMYDEQGTAVDVQFRWAKMSSTPETWNLFYQSNADATGTQAMWTNAGTDFTFDSSGNLTAPGTDSIVISGMSVGSSSLGDIDFTYGDSGLTQYSVTQGNVDVTLLDQDGYSTGALTGVGVSDDGRITATYTNGQQVDLAEVPLYQFNADQSLKRLDGSAFAPTRDSGVPLLMSNPNITGGALEGSNTDIAEEFSKMIVTQQAYSANSKIITTTNDMMQDVLNIVR